MAVATLSPWPAITATVSLEAARACLRAELGDMDDSKLDRLGSTAAALVERYAPGAPQPVKNEAVIRCVGWLAEQPGASIRSEQVGDVRTEYAPTSLSALRHSGAMALLTAWKVRRARAIG